jgi:type II secretory pathway pseudopilin PulG
MRHHLLRGTADMSHHRYRHRGFTLVELLVLIVVGVVAFGLFSALLPTPAREIASQAVCGANIYGMYKAMYAYSQRHNDGLPIAGARSDADPAVGFRGNDLIGSRTVPAADPRMVNNVTASLWILVRDGSVSPKGFICPSTPSEKESLTNAGGQSVDLDQTWDFTSSDHLSYSPLNMYHVMDGPKWCAEVPVEWVMMADDNNADHAPLVGSAGRKPGAEPRDHNSRNHGGEGQNLLFGDGHVAWTIDPNRGLRPATHDEFGSPASRDNVYTQIVNGQAAPPTLGNTDGDRVQCDTIAATDVMLVPLTGNNGVSLSGQPAVEGQRGDGDAWGDVFGVVLLLGLLLGLPILLLLLRDRFRDAWRSRHPQN